MRVSTIKAFSVYTLTTLVVLGWWLLAFQFDRENSSPVDILPINRQPTLSLGSLSPLSREKLQLALSGDAKTMGEFLLEWDVDAQWLEAQQIKKIHRLPNERILRAQLLARELLEQSATLQNGRFLPQTFVAASYLLALTSPEEIAALPKGLRDLTQLYPRSLTDRVPLDISRYHSERLFLGEPDLAFVANYSDPATLQALKAQHIPLYSIDAPGSLEEISLTLQRLGHLIGRSKEAELLTIFIEGCFCTIDNRLLYLRQQAPIKSLDLNIAFLNYHSQFSIPGEQTLTVQLLRRLGIGGWLTEAIKERNDPWLMPIESEQIINSHPDALIISTSNPVGLYRTLYRERAFRSYFTPNRRVFLLDSSIQESPTQYIILAYYDIYEALNAIMNSMTEADS